MLTETARTPAGPKARIGEAELAEGLMLVRASTLKILRLQLAIERRDRRSAIEAVDELLEIDRNLAQCLPLADLDEERAALNHEKLTLAAQVITRDPWVDPTHEPAPVILEAEPWDSGGAEDALAEQAPRRRALWWLVGVLLVLSALAAAGFLVDAPSEIARFAPNLGGIL